MSKVKWSRVPNSRFDRIGDLYAAKEAVEESGQYLEVRVRHRYDEDGDFKYGFLEHKGTNPQQRYYEPCMLPGFGDF